MTYALTQARRMTSYSADAIRVVIVCSCSLALIAAGQALPL